MSKNTYSVYLTGQRHAYQAAYQWLVAADRTPAEVRAWLVEHAEQCKQEEPPVLTAERSPQTSPSQSGTQDRPSPRKRNT